MNLESFESIWSGNTENGKAEGEKLNQKKT